MKKIIIMLLLALVIGISGIPAAAQQAEFNEEEIMEAFAKEPPITQADIDTFIKYFPELNKAAESDDEALAKEVIEKTGWTEIRLAYVALKLGLGWGMIYDAESAELMRALFPPEMLPTAPEMKLIEQNMDKLTPFFDEEGAE